MNTAAPAKISFKQQMLQAREDAIIRAVNLLLAEKGVAHDTVQIDLRSREQLGEAFRRINPQCTVPALVTDEGPVLTDNAAIAAYLEARFPEPPLLGRTALEKAEIASWQWRVEFEGLMPIAEALRNSSPAMANRALPGPVDYAQIPELAQRGLARLQQSQRASEQSQPPETSDSPARPGRNATAVASDPACGLGSLREGRRKRCCCSGSVGGRPLP